MIDSTGSGRWSKITVTCFQVKLSDDSCENQSMISQAFVPYTWIFLQSNISLIAPPSTSYLIFPLVIRLFIHRKKGSFIDTDIHHSIFSVIAFVTPTKSIIHIYARLMDFPRIVFALMKIKITTYHEDYPIKLYPMVCGEPCKNINYIASGNSCFFQPRVASPWRQGIPINFTGFPLINCRQFSSANKKRYQSYLFHETGESAWNPCDDDISFRPQSEFSSSPGNEASVGILEPRISAAFEICRFIIHE